jgi:NitT/TauT family transport system substrate-binding protein
MPEVAFSSVCALPEFLETKDCAAFLRAFAKAKRWVQESPSEEVAEAETSYFPEIHQSALAQSIDSYQKVGCWLGGLAISRPLYEQSLRVFGLSAAAHPYEEVVRLPGDANLL